MTQTTAILNVQQEAVRLKQLARDVLAMAKAKGASSAELNMNCDAGFSINVRMGEVETVEYNRDTGAGITVYFGQCKGSAGSTDLSIDSLKAAVDAACAIAKYTQPDPYAGLADKNLMAWSYPDLDLYHPWGITPEEAIKLALTCEKYGRDFDSRIVNSEGASVSTVEGFYLYANSHDFIGSFPTTRHNLSCVLVAKENDKMQRDYYYSSGRAADQLLAAKVIAEKAASRTIRRLNGRTIKTNQLPVIFEAEIAAGLLSSFIGGIRGSNLYRRASFLLDQLGQPIFPKHINIYELPHLTKAVGSTPFDGEGVAITRRDFIREGVLESYVLNSYSARKLGMQTTGNAGGVRNLTISHSENDLPALLKKMHKGLLITEVMGQGVNIVTGDYSRGASGFWVENGEIQYPVEEFTIAGNLREMFQDIIAVGNDIDLRGNTRTGSILLEKMMVAGQ